MSFADLSQLPPVPDQRGRDVEEFRDELLGVIRQGIDDRPRGKQTRLGPSEIGIPCARRLGYKLGGVEEVQPDRGSWRPTVGTAVHAWLADTFVEANRGLDVARWLVEMKVEAGRIGADVLDGTCDLYDRATATVVDWKVVGPTSLKNSRANGPGEQYRVQAHTYGRGWTRRGMPVDRVGVMFLPSSGELRDAAWWAEPYAAEVAEKAISRADGIAALVAAAGAEAVTVLPTAPAYCTRCPWYLPAATELTEACPGHRD